MAESRIIGYDGDYVTFWYQRHENDKIVIERIHAFEFIARLIVHIPDQNFKYIRFYGAYCNTSNCHKSFLKLFNELPQGKTQNCSQKNFLFELGILFRKQTFVMFSLYFRGKPRRI